MKDFLLLALLLMLFGTEAAVYVKNPFRAPDGNLPARLFGLEPFQEPQRSMLPTVAAKRYLLVSAWPYLQAPPQAGDIVAFVYPPNHLLADLKRIVATGGSTIQITNGITLIDGKPLDEPYLRDRAPAANYSRYLRPVRVPLNSYFVMGDNRDESEDSRVFGVIGRDSIIGKMSP